MRKYQRRRVYISHLESEAFDEVIILKEFQWLGQWWLRCKYVEGGEITDLPVACITQLLHRKSKVVDLKKRMHLVKKANSTT